MSIVNQEKEGFKKTKLGWIPKDWKVSKLKDAAEVITGSTPSTKDVNNYGSDYLFIGPGDLDRKYIDRASKMLSEQGFLSARRVPKNSSLFICIGSTIGKVGFVREVVATNQQINAIHSVSNENEFLYYYLILISGRVKNLASEQAVPMISKGEFQLFDLVLPPLPEQKAIANCLSTWDTAITKLDSLIKAKQQLKKALMQQLLSGKKRLPGFDGEWEEKRLDYFFDERSERNNSEDLELLSIGEAGVYPQDNSNKKDTSNADKSKYKKICVGDIGYNTMRMWQGRSALSSLEGIVSPAYTIVKPKENTDSQFFAYLFKDPAIIHRFYRNSQGMVSDTLNCKFKDFSIIKLVLPLDKKEQTGIAQVLNTADQEIELLTTQRNQLQLQKKGLMQQLLTGKKRLKVCQ